MSYVVYFIEHLNFGDNDDRTGWYLMRATIADDRGLGLARGIIIDRKPLALFERSTDGAMEARCIQDAAQTGCFHVLPRDWTIESAAHTAGKK